MIPVKPKPEPATFQKTVRQKGLAWIHKSGLDPALPVPRGTKIPSHWTKCLDDLWSAYDEVCAYVCLHIPKITGAKSVEHFAPKSKRLDQAYEWSNYRLVCARLNSRKRDFEDVLDPFTLKKDTFLVDFVTGRIVLSSALSAAKRAAAKDTVDRLKLDEPDLRKQRLADLDKALDGDWSVKELKKVSPFVWYEAKRQGLI